VIQSALIAGGTIVGLCHSLRGESAEARTESPPEYLEILSRLEALERSAPPFAVPKPDENVSRLEVATSLDRVAADLRREMDLRFGAQDSAIEALRQMTAHTSEMIGRLLERLESNPEFGADPDDLAPGDADFISVRQ
jgi:hypothetical protein